ncbi:hypothetical protein PWT90_07289 [Aphanocladium album]|nr:hypothetical protein PWT90_07289 [Aphanocladium album]
MQIFQTLFAIAAVATTAAAAPLEARTPDWIIEGLSRSCDSKDTSCTWKFTINNQETARTGCTYVVKAANGQPAYRDNEVNYGKVPNKPFHAAPPQ